MRSTISMRYRKNINYSSNDVLLRLLVLIWFTTWALHLVKPKTVSKKTYFWVFVLPNTWLEMLIVIVLIDLTEAFFLKVGCFNINDVRIKIYKRYKKIKIKF